MARQEKQAALGLLIGILGGFNKRRGNQREQENALAILTKQSELTQQRKEADPKRQAQRQALSYPSSMVPLPFQILD